MARIRSVKPELRRDMTVAGWTREIRYAWVLLWGYLDDSGRGIDDLRLLVADLFPLDRDVTEHKLDVWLQTMATPTIHGAPVICRYNVDGLAYLHSPKWSRSQKVSHRQASRIPACPHHDAQGSPTGVAPEADQSQNGTGQESVQTSYAPEGQGVKGSRERGNAGATVDGNQLLADHCALLKIQPPRDIKKRMGVQIDALVSEGLTSARIAAGLAVMRAKPHMGPGLLASAVSEADNQHGPQISRDANGVICPVGQEHLEPFERFRQVRL